MLKFKSKSTQGSQFKNIFEMESDFTWCFQVGQIFIFIWYFFLLITFFDPEWKYKKYVLNLVKVLGQQSIVHYNAKKRESYVCHQILLRWCQEKYFEERVNLFEPPSPLADILVTCSNKINSFRWLSVFTSYFTFPIFPLSSQFVFFRKNFRVTYYLNQITLSCQASTQSLTLIVNVTTLGMCH